ncbi:MAG: dienelactone hydrolase family protein [Planctomycetota bacterium]
MTATIDATELWTESSRYPREQSFTRFTLMRPRPLEPYPAVVMVGDADGMSPLVRELAQRLAQAGYVAFAVDLFSRFGVARPADPATGLVLLKSVPDRHFASDLEHGVRYLRRRADVDLQRIGVLGLGAGGHYAYEWCLQNRDARALVCVQAPHLTGADAAVTAAGAERPLQAATDSVARLECPLLTLWGERDPAVAAGSIEALGRTLEQHHRVYHLKTYPTAGANLLDVRAAQFDRAVADDCWSLITRFLGERVMQKAGSA